MIRASLPQVAQRVEDLDRAVSFYRDVLGLHLIARFDPPGMAFFDLGATRLLLGTEHYSSSLFLEVDDIDVTCVSLRAHGVEIDRGPALMFRDDDGVFGRPGTEELMAFFWDSERNLVGLIERRHDAG